MRMPPKSFKMKRGEAGKGTAPVGARRLRRFIFRKTQRMAALAGMGTLKRPEGRAPAV